MFSRRLATFILGMWLGCCILVDLFLLQADSVTERVLATQLGKAKPLLDSVGSGPAGVLLHHLSGEFTRALLSAWEPAQLLLSALILVLLVFTESRKLVAIAMCALLGIVTGIQYFFLSPEWTFLGRELDFLEQAASFTVRTQVWEITRAYAGLEIVKILLGGALASYFFAMESVVKRRVSRHSSSRSRAEAASSIE